MGVDLFFVLSGYLITTILLGLRGQPTPYKTFYSRRALRIFPPYLALTAACLALALVFHRAPTLLTPAFILRQVFFLQAYFPNDLLFVKDFFFHLRWYATHPPNLLQYAHNLPEGSFGLVPSLAGPASTFWSLSIEEYFYLLWAPIVLRCSRPIIISTGVFICVVELILRCYYPGYLAYFGIFFRFDALLYGAFLALLMEAWRRSAVPTWASRAFVVILVLALATDALILSRLTPLLGREIRYAPLMLGPGLALMSIATAALVGLLILHANSGWWLARLLRLRALQFLGTISYTMYVVHILVALIVMMALSRLEHRLPGSYLLVEAIVSAVITVVVARLSWHFMEKPLLRWKDRRFPGVKVAEPHLN
jgi:peptidoglycan/LPS O-acetylase OafA/YrhL